MTALINAMRVLTDPSETGACCIALPQDVEGESYDYPDYFFEKRVHRITRPVAVEEELEDIAEIIAKAKRPLLIVGGGVKYSEAGETVEKFCEEFHIPFGESRQGKCVPDQQPLLPGRYRCDRNPGIQCHCKRRGCGDRSRIQTFRLHNKLQTFIQK